MLDVNAILGQLSVLEGLISEVKDARLHAKMMTEIIKLKQMLGG